MSTPLYDWYLAGSDPEDMAFVARVWGPTPWMIRTNARQAGKDSLDVLNEQCRWCRDHIGPTAEDDAAGLWRHGYCVHDEMRWFGFATEELMNRFVAVWGGVTTP